MAKKFYGRLTRDIVVEITMTDAFTGKVNHVTQLPSEAGVYVFTTAKRRDAWIAPINAEHPSAAVVEQR